jgi:hypothetical protein
MTARLPAAFADLERFAPQWCLATETKRYARRMNSSMAQLQEFYDAFSPRLEAAIEHCDTYALEALPPDAIRLLQLVYSLTTVAMSIEIFQQIKATNSADAEITRVQEPQP